MRILLGIDPGFADAGYGVIETDGFRDRCLAYGSLKTSAGQPHEIRLQKIYDDLSKLIENHRPAAAAIEKLYFSKNVKTAIAVAEARGVIRLCLIQHGVPCREFGPGEVKTAVSGYGLADKSQMQRMIKALLGLKETPKPDDAADALALAIALAHEGPMKR
ncbi:MAG: crossover junction endodeoxyribonuclease RuvC [Patescibacteria group bacterium]|nr:crossover junction endodeoxyribonuclease RuvC [Patescibacteria group bacterium]